MDIDGLFAFCLMLRQLLAPSEFLGTSAARLYVRSYAPSCWCRINTAAKQPVSRLCNPYTTEGAFEFDDTVDPLLASLPNTTAKNNIYAMYKVLTP